MTDLSAILKLEPPEAAPQLLGAMLVSEVNGRVVRGVITETEAYTSDDPASHSYRGESTRNAALFGEPGDIYVYFIYGLHFCFNVVTGTRDGGAVLVRAVEIIDGLEYAWERRYKEPLPTGSAPTKMLQLSNGPAKVAQAFGIDLRCSHHNLLDPESPLRLYEGSFSKVITITQTPRIGITKGAEVPWRWVAKYH